jgi:hypothetical protein
MGFAQKVERRTKSADGDAARPAQRRCHQKPVINHFVQSSLDG